VLIPAENEKDLADIPAAVKDALEIVPVSHVDEVLARALVEPLHAIEWTEDDEHAAEPPVAAPGAEPGAAVRH
jgi:ATP-dependent Lon protease